MGLLAGQARHKITIISDVTEDSIVDVVEDASTENQFVIIDLEGTASLMVANAIGMSDLVVIPNQGALHGRQGRIQDHQAHPQPGATGQARDPLCRLLTASVRPSRPAPQERPRPARCGRYRGHE